MTTAAVPYQPPNSKGCGCSPCNPGEKELRESQRMAGKEGAREGADASTAAAVENAAAGDSGTGELSTKKVAVPAAAPKRTTSQEVSWFEAVPLGPRTAAAEVWRPRVCIIATPRGGWGVCATGGLWKSTEKSACPRKNRVVSRVATCCLLPYRAEPWFEGDS